MKLSNGTKVLNVHINEYESLEALQDDFLNMPKEMSKNGKKLNDSRNKALKGLEYQYKHCYGRMSRQFYWEKTPFEGTDYFQMYELVLD